MQHFQSKEKKHGYSYIRMKMWNLTWGKLWAKSRTPSPSAMYINDDFRSITTKNSLGIRIYIREKERGDMIEPILPWLGFA